jgi:hypothetical protein
MTKEITMDHIVYNQDKNLVVSIDRDDPAAPVTFMYTAFDDAHRQSTPFQTADMPDDDQAAAAMVNEYAANIAG